MEEIKSFQEHEDDQDQDHEYLVTLPLHDPERDANLYYRLRFKPK